MRSGWPQRPADSVTEVLHHGLHVVRHHADAPGPSVVLVHGAPDRSKNLARVVHLLSDLPVTVYDRRGYGKSLHAGEGGGGFQVHADDLLDLLDGTPSVVVGQSAGGAIAMMAAVQAPELFLALGVWEPPMVASPWWIGQAAMDRTAVYGDATDPFDAGEQFNRFLLGDERWEALRPSTQELLRAEGVAFRADMHCQRVELVDPRDVEVPMIVGCGTVHAGPEFTRAHRAVDERAGAELFVGEGADHAAHMSHPDIWAGLVRRTVALAAERSVDR